MSLSLDRCAEDLQKGVISARQAGENQNISQSLNFLAKTLQILSNAKSTATEIEGLSGILPGFNLAKPISTSAIDELVRSMWAKFIEADYYLPPDQRASDISDEIRNKAYQLGEQAWVSFRDAQLVEVDLNMDLPNSDMLLIIDPNLNVPGVFGMWKSSLQRFVGKSFKELWEECDGTAESFVNEQVSKLKEWVSKITEVVEPIMKAISGLHPAVKSALEEALSSNGAQLRLLDDPAMVAWISKNPRVKDLLVIRFRQSN